MRLLRESQYWAVHEDSARRIVFLRRTAVAFPSLEVLQSESDAVIAQIRHFHAQFGLVVDLRLAPVRNDPASESAARSLREGVNKAFARVALLLESAVGVLQVTRIGRDDAHSSFATRDEIDAIRFAMGEPPGQP